MSKEMAVLLMMWAGVAPPTQEETETAKRSWKGEGTDIHLMYREGPLLSQVSTLNMTIGVVILRQSGNHLGLSIGPHVVHQRICPWTAI